MFGSISACVYSDGPKPGVAPLQLCPVMFERDFRPRLYKFFPGGICFLFFTPKTHAYSNKRTHVLLCFVAATWFVERAEIIIQRLWNAMGRIEFTCWFVILFLFCYFFSLCCFSRVASKKSGAIYQLITASAESFISAVSTKHHVGGSKWGPSTPLSVKYLSFSRSFRQKYCKTRMHSSRMRTVRCSGRL